jgi:hypothetical protein
MSERSDDPRQIAGPHRAPPALVEANARRVQAGRGCQLLLGQACGTAQAPTQAGRERDLRRRRPTGDLADALLRNAVAGGQHGEGHACCALGTDLPVAFAGVHQYTDHGAGSDAG